MTNTEAAASQLLVAAATRAARGTNSSDHVRDYFATRSRMERDLRTPFVALRRRFDAGGELSAADLVPRLRDVNREYRTRCAIVLLAPLADAMIERLRAEPWWQSGTRPRLLIDGDGAEALGKVVPDIVAALRRQQPGSKRPYSLTSKCLHFLFSDGFAIYDAQASESVQMWSYFAFPPDHPDAQPFARRRLDRTSGAGYRHLLDFYVRLWAALSPEERDGLSEAARSLEPLLGVDDSARGEFIGPLDVLDKHLWKSEGNPVRLGVADPHTA